MEDEMRRFLLPVLFCNTENADWLWLYRAVQQISRSPKIDVSIIAIVQTILKPDKIRIRSFT